MVFKIILGSSFIHNFSSELFKIFIKKKKGQMGNYPEKVEKYNQKLKMQTWAAIRSNNFYYSVVITYRTPLWLPALKPL